MSTKKLIICKINSDFLVEKGYQIPPESGHWYCIILLSNEKKSIIGRPTQNKADVITQLNHYRSQQIKEYQKQIKDLEKKFTSMKFSLNDKNRHEKIIEICSVVLATSVLFPVFRDIFGLINEVKDSFADAVIDIETIKIVDWGILKLDIAETVDDPNQLSGKYNILKSAKITKKTNKIPASSNTSFGIIYIVKGFPPDVKVQIDAKWLYPGIKHSETGTIIYSSKRRMKVKIGQIHPMAYTIGSEPELGGYAFQLFHKGKLLAEKKFEVITSSII